ncbi:ABC transporter ATP-binding protein [Devosia aurantiaca]|uniref:ABC transporter ATP-binding protein n=1 Tax=Devosia aurantiaca TaxID=2714858 RepID=A0A6M1SAK6_9HYPH|nr:ABC transporter ATP-binding protein [Devosia aurantiaca]NGP16979.1 ABC transporter ATP-binding protein [Devosia aurantiaca]
MTAVKLKAVSKSFGDSLVLNDISLSLATGSFTALLGPSGCGKTTLLRLIAGFEQPSTGAVVFDGVTMADGKHSVPPEKRSVGIVFQSYALWPHMSVAGNVAYPLKGLGLSRETIRARVDEALAMVALRGFGDQHVDSLSGGQRQRVALARCLVNGTKLILLDEPLANLDVHLRASMLDVFADIHQRTGATIVFVTHDQSEALALADTVVVLDGGRIQQSGRPETIYAEPANAMVAGFVGDGRVIEADVRGGMARLGPIDFSVRGVGEGRQQLLVRPHAIRTTSDGLPVRVERRRYSGTGYETMLRLDDGAMLIADLAERVEIGSAISIAIDDAWIVPR